MQHLDLKQEDTLTINLTQEKNNEIIFNINCNNSFYRILFNYIRPN